jgi:hypothetical protein
MALTPQSTLGEITSQILEAIGEGGDGVAAPNTISMIHSLIQRHQTLLVNECPWTINRTRIEVELAANVTILDFPDGWEPGGIGTISVRRATNPQDEWTLVAGITADDRASWISGVLSANSYSPSNYTILDGSIEVGPACSEAVTIFIEGRVGKASMVEEDDRPNCDSTALAMKAEIAYRNARGGDFRNAIPVLMNDLRDYLSQLKPKQGVKRLIVPGSQFFANDPARRCDPMRSRHWSVRDIRP